MCVVYTHIYECASHLDAVKRNIEVLKLLPNKEDIRSMDFMKMRCIIKLMRNMLIEWQLNALSGIANVVHKRTAIFFDGIFIASAILLC